MNIESRNIISSTNEAFFVEPEMVRNLEGGFNGKPITRLLVLNAAWIAGGGPGTQLAEVIQGAKKLAETKNLDIQYVGTPLSDIPIPTIAKIPEVNGAQAKYRAAEQAVTEALLSLNQTTNEEIIGVLSIGYTAYGPEAIKAGLKNVYRLTGRQMKAVVVNFDSSYPDTDNPSTMRDLSGSPLDRFNPEGYMSTDDAYMYQVIVNPTGVNVKSGMNRAPKGTVCVSASLPFTDTTVESLRALREISRSSAREEIIKTFSEKGCDPQLLRALQDQQAIFIPFVASSGYFDAANVGKWMTKNQYADFQKGVALLLNELTQVAEKLKRPIVVTGVEEFIRYAESLGIASIQSYQQTDTPSVFVAKKPQLSRYENVQYMKAADIAIQRTTQTNSFGEAALSGVPCIVLTIPADNYMNADNMDRQWKEKGGLQVETSSYRLGTLQQYVELLLKNPLAREKLVALQAQIVDNVDMNPESNFFAIIQRLFGLT